MFDLPPSLARHFRTPSGKIDYLGLLRTPDGGLVDIARDMDPGERVRLYHRLRQHRIGFVEGMLAAAAGVDIEAQRRRMMRVLEAAHNEPAEVVPV